MNVGGNYFESVQITCVTFSHLRHQWNFYKLRSLSPRSCIFKPPVDVNSWKICMRKRSDIINLTALKPFAEVVEHFQVLSGGGAGVNKQEAEHTYVYSTKMGFAFFIIAEEYLKHSINILVGFPEKQRSRSHSRHNYEWRQWKECHVWFSGKSSSSLTSQTNACQNGL